MLVMPHSTTPDPTAQSRRDPPRTDRPRIKSTMSAIVNPMRAPLTPSRRHPAATDRTSTHRTSTHRAHAGLLALLLACAPPAESRPAPPTAPPAEPTRTANNDARGAGVQPDYDGEAVLLREQMLPRLQGPLPADRRSACTAMLDAAATFYSTIEADPAARAQLLADLKATRDSELLACERETSVRAASCVQLRLADRDAELPWLLDQCSRAFPQ